ncbi:Dol-P-Man:Man(5)GlcNAc(2)-PP-Dol alpha-1,3-mannosyltransferase [Hypsibius exemplaris]|uniref:dolichyl-P-Man:Man5GlcNAc2-PP-dolichol alpha-1,3-mannosyltransferase n=1 Tax=Hypsibius exemplaris TaxID=2072580 RepID=A0A1W0WA48_HYPEX|nr:Dol-P-Man:Man(5)GlcNAc(2)-PP-Dol alpha-1,3-mannosyltransferase [Hypsibius exemplaris]
MPAMPANRPRGNKPHSSKQSTSKLPRTPAAFVALIESYIWNVVLSMWNPKVAKRWSRLLLVLEVCLCATIIKRVNYTEIDWQAYMQEVEGFLNGTLDYSKLEGGTGPLVYPAGFVYIFSGLYYLTDHGKDVVSAQAIFAGIYIAMLALVFRLYIKTRHIAPYVLVIMSLTSFRIHSLFVLRLFNDCVAMLLFYGSANLFVGNRWLTGCLLFSSAVSVKMSVLLFAPGLLFLLLQQGYRTTVLGLAICAGWQVLLATPFLIVNPIAYLERSFDLGRVFLYEWTVNWRFVSEKFFLDRSFHVALFGLHLVLLVALCWRCWLPLRRAVRTTDAVGVNAKLMVLFTSNFVGIACSRSMHYQFYVWYFHTLHFLLWTMPMRFVTRALLLGMIEFAFAFSYPSTNFSSGVLFLSHVFIVASILRNGPSRSPSVALNAP